MKSRMIVSFMVIALAAALIGGATMAWFTDSKQLNRRPYSRHLDIGLNENLTETITISH